MSRQNQEPDELRARFTVYIKQVIIHAKLDYIRKKNRTSQEISLEDLDFEPAVDFEEQYSFEFEEEHLANAFAALPLLRQKVLEMLFVQELTPLEISKRMHCSVKYVYDQKYLALQKLRRLLGGEPHGK